MEALGELLQVPCCVSTTHWILAKQLKNTERSLKFLARHDITQSFQLLPRRTVTTVPYSFCKLPYIINSACKGARAYAI